MKFFVAGFVLLSAASVALAGSGSGVCHHLEVLSGKDGEVVAAGSVSLAGAGRYVSRQLTSRYRNELAGVIGEGGVSLMANNLVDVSYGLTAAFEGAELLEDGSVKVLGEARQSWVLDGTPVSVSVARQPLILAPNSPVVLSMRMPDGVRSFSFLISEKKNHC